MIFPDWIKKGIISFPFYPLDVYPFTPLLRRESYLVSTSSPPDIIIQYISLSTPLLFCIEIYVRL